MSVLRKIAYKIEKFRLYNHLNLIMTLWVNLRWFPFKVALRFPVYVYGKINYMGNGKAAINGEIKRGMIVINKTYPWGPANPIDKTTILNSGTIIFNGPAIIKTGVKIAIEKGARLNLGRYIRIADSTIIGCANSIKLGNYVRIAHRSQVFDTNYHFIIDLKDGTVNDNKFQITIGDYSWLANTVTVCGNIELPPYTVVASNSLLTKSLPNLQENTMIGGVPAKIIKTGVRQVFSEQLELRLIDYFERNPHSSCHCNLDQNTIINIH